MSNRFPTAAILLSAGLGTRMRPLTETTPKPLVEVAGQSLLARSFANAKAEGVSEFVVNVHYLADQLEQGVARLAETNPDCAFFISNERRELLDTGGGVKQALVQTKADPVLVMNTDSFWPLGADQPIARMAAQMEEGVDAVLLCAHPARSTGFRRSHDFCLAPDKAITLDRGVPVIYAGICLLRRSLFNRFAHGKFSLNEIFNPLLEEKRLRGELLNAPWLHVGDEAGIAEAEQVLEVVG